MVCLLKKRKKKEIEGKKIRDPDLAPSILEVPEQITLDLQHVRL